MCNRQKMRDELIKHSPACCRYYKTLSGKQLAHEYYDLKRKQEHSYSLRKSDAHPILDLYSKRRRSIIRR